MDGQKRKDLENAEQATWDLQLRIMRDIPREERSGTKTSPGSKGWRIAKFHVLSLMASLNLKFGRAQCYDTSCNEKNHKYFVKGNAQLTQRIASKFSSQLCSNDYDRVAIETAYQHVQQYCSQDLSRSTAGNRADLSPLQYYSDSSSDSDSDSDSSECESDYETEVMPTDKHCTNLVGMHRLSVDVSSNKRVTVSHQWKAKQFNVLGVEPCAYVHKTISDASIKYTTNHQMEHDCHLDVECYTGAVVRGYKYRATPFWKGGEWYDWACVKFPKTVLSVPGSKCICRVMGFFRYKSPGAMTFQNVEVHGLAPEEIVGVDHTLYAVLHCQTSYFDFSHLQSKFIRKFTMTPSTDMYILPAKCIVSPVLVVPDIEDAETASHTNFMAIVSRHKMGVYFLHHVNWCVQEEEDAMELDNIGYDSDIEDTW